MDGVMCEDIRIGVLARTELQKFQFRRPGGGPWISFSSLAISWAGGLLPLLTEWERELLP